MIGSSEKQGDHYPLISIVVPIYNVEEYLPLCLNCLARQTYPNIEVLMINDGSPDNSEAICLQYADTHSNFYYYKKANGGLSDARNFGIERAKGEYIGFVDSDDYLSESMYSIMYQNITRYDADIAAVGFAEVTSRDHKEVIFDDLQAEIYGTEEAIKILFNNDKFANFAWNKLYRTKLFEQVRYPVGRKMEDLGTTYKLFCQSKKVVFYPAKLYFYFQRADSILHVRGRDFYEDKLALAQERYLDLRVMYPSMIENDTFYLNAVFDCLPNISEDSETARKAVLIIRNIPNKKNKQLSVNRKIKFYFIKYASNLYKVIFR